eukprot:gene475-504_t
MLLKSRKSSSSDYLQEDTELFFIDYGLVEKYTQYREGCHAEKTNRGGVAGTPAFVSVTVHEGSSPARKDDVEAMGYVLLSLSMGGNLPWSTAKSDEECRRMKKECDIRRLASDLDMPEVGEIILRCRSLSHTQEPDYDHYLGLLSAMSSRKPSLPVDRRQPLTSRASGQSQPRSGGGGKLRGRPRSSGKEEEEDPPSDKENDEAIGLCVEEPRVPTETSKGSARRTRKTRTARPQEPVPDVLPKPNKDGEVDMNPSLSRSALCVPVGELPNPPPRDRSGAHPFSEEEVRSQHAGAKSAIFRAEDQLPSTGLQAGPDHTVPDSQPGPFQGPSPRRRPERAASRGSRESSASAATAMSVDPLMVGIVLEIMSGPMRGQVYGVPARVSASRRAGGPEVGEEVGLVTVGREGCDLALPHDEYVSERHATVRLVAGVSGELAVELMDLASTNGTKVNRFKKIPKKRWVRANVGDTLTVGETEIKVVLKVM